MKKRALATVCASENMPEDSVKNKQPAKRHCRNAVLWSYNTKADAGMSPAVQDSLLSLALGELTIRENAKLGDYIVGFAEARPQDNCCGSVTYIAEVTHIKSVTGYHTTFSRPDNIYRVTSTGQLVHKGCTSFRATGSVQADAMRRDDAQGSVLLSTRFVRRPPGNPLPAVPQLLACHADELHSVELKCRLKEVLDGIIASHCG